MLKASNPQRSFAITPVRTSRDAEEDKPEPVSYTHLCSILFGALAAFVFHCSVPVVYMILMSDEIIKIPITWRRYKSYKWLKDVTREEL